MTPEIEELYQQIGQVLVQGIDKDAIKAWAYVELTDDAGSVSVYYQTPDGRIHAHASAGAQHEHALFQTFDDLRRLWAASIGEPWTIASYSWESPKKFSIDFGYEDVSDRGATMDRRDVWEKRQFGDAPVEVFAR